jgi:hypothetical protein
MPLSSICAVPRRGTDHGVNHMSDYTAIDFDLTEEEILHYEVSDEQLEVASGEQTWTTTSFHGLSCCTGC